MYNIWFEQLIKCKIIIIIIISITEQCHKCYVKGKVDETQQNNRCTLSSDRGETISRIISEFNKLAQKECKTRYDWVRKETHWELCKNFKFDYTNK